MFTKLIKKIYELKLLSFEPASKAIEQFINDSQDFYSIAANIGTIPECIAHDSTAEKLFSKASDAVLCRAFNELGLEAHVITKRGNSADVFAKSYHYGYELVADAKSFRMSRTAKNQKDFKVDSLSGWRGNADFAVLCSPYFQYPKTQSQIYKQAISNNVCLLSWEHVLFLIKNNVKESKTVNLQKIWQFSKNYASECSCKDSTRCFIPIFDNYILKFCNISHAEFSQFLHLHIASTKKRSNEEVTFIKNEIARVKNLPHSQAIDELLKSKKLDDKMQKIKKFAQGLNACLTK